MMQFKNKKNKISLDVIFLFLFVLNFMQIVYGYLNSLKFIVFWIIGFILIFIYLFLSFKKNNGTEIHYYKLGVILFLIIWLVLTPMFNSIYLRHTTSPILDIHDGALQMEEAIKFIIQGKNPYTENYLNTPLQQLWGGKISTTYGLRMVNPSLYHFIVLPWHLFFSVPFYVLSMLTLGWYDQRFVFILLFLITLLILYKIPREKSNKLLFLILFAFNPLFITNFIGGLNDIFVFFWIILSIYLLQIKKIKLSSLSLGLAVMSKHSAWFLIPFYFFYLFLQTKGTIFLIKVKSVLKQTLPFWISIIVLALPFLLWDFNSFISDIYKYPAGVLPTSYPINGNGLATFLLAKGIVKSPFNYFPFWIPQLIVGIPLFYFLIKTQIKRNTLSQMIFNYTIFLFVFWVFSRFFHANYMGFLTALIICVYFLDKNDDE